MLTRPRPSPRTSLRDESGVTLVELLVVLLLTGIVGTIVLRSVVAASDITVVGTQRADALEDARPAIQRMTRELRAADPMVLSPTLSYETELSAVVRRGGVTYRHHYEVIEGAEPGEQELWEEVLVVADDGSETLDRASQLVVLIDTGDPIFRYLDANGTELVCTDLDLSTVDGNNACRSRLVSTSQVGISISRDIPGQATDIEIDTTVSIRSVRYGT